MSRWHIVTSQLDEREGDYTAGFTCTNTDTKKVVVVQLTQGKGPGGPHPVTDLIEALRSVASLLVRTSFSEADEPEPAPRVH